METYQKILIGLVILGLIIGGWFLLSGSINENMKKLIFLKVGDKKYFRIPHKNDNLEPVLPGKITDQDNQVSKDLITKGKYL